MNASARATLICRGIALWAICQDTKPSAVEYEARMREWCGFITGNGLDAEIVDYIKAMQYGIMTWAINHS